MNDVLVIVPAFDEATVVRTVVTQLLALGCAVAVIDDGSRDDTAAQAAAAGARVLRHPVNLGQGAALQTGFEYARKSGAQIVVTFDADGQHRVDDVAALVAAVRAGADVALGSRGLGGTVGATFGRRVLLRAATWLSNRLSRQELTDSHCGLRAIHVDALARLHLRCNGMAHASELLGQLRREALRVVEVPVVVQYTAYSRAKGQSALGAVRILWDMFFRRAHASMGSA